VVAAAKPKPTTGKPVVHCEPARPLEMNRVTPFTVLSEPVTIGPRPESAGWGKVAGAARDA